MSTSSIALLSSLLLSNLGSYTPAYAFTTVPTSTSPSLNFPFLDKSTKLSLFNIGGNSDNSNDDFNHKPNKQDELTETSIPSPDSKMHDETLSTSQSSSPPLTPLSESPKRKQRKRRESILKRRFVSGNDLIELRKSVSEKQALLKHNIRYRQMEEAEQMRVEIRDLQSRDAEYVYFVAKKQLEEAANSKASSSQKDIKRLKQVVKDARSCIPHFNLEGLWVGKYGDHGYEMINVTYIGDNLVAYKVTGDKNVPKGEITFQADLSPVYPTALSSSSSSNNKQRQALEPIQLTESAAKAWGTKHLHRFPGLGQVASEGFTNSQWMDGQLILVGEQYFSFAWVPIQHQIFFGRPSLELMMKMMKEASSNKDDTREVKRMREVAHRCLEETLVLEDEQHHHHSRHGIIVANGSFE